MPLYTKGPVTNEQKDALDYEAPFGEYMGAMVEQGLRDLPAAQSLRVTMVEEADAPAAMTQDDAYIIAADPNATDAATVFARQRQLRRDSPESQAARMSKADALAKAQAAGVTINVPERGLTPFAVDLLINEAKDKNKRAMTLERHQAGWGSVAGWGAYFGVQLLDPVNVTTSYVPVFRHGVYMNVLRRATQFAGAGGRTIARAGMGATEGVVGSALVEPMIYSNEQVLNADYGMADSLLNIAFGGVLGGGLHAVGGGVADLYRARTGAAQPWAAPQVLEDVRRMKKPALVRVLQKDVNVREGVDLSKVDNAAVKALIETGKLPEAKRDVGAQPVLTLDERIDAAVDEANRLKDAIDGYSPKNATPLIRALEAIGSAMPSTDDLLAAAKWAKENGRDDIAQIAAERAERIAKAAAEAKPGVSPDSPKYQAVLDALRKRAEDAAREAAAIRDIASAMTRAAAVAADARAEIAAGNMWDVDIADDLRAAVEKMDDLRRRGMSVQEFFDQMDAFGSGLTPEAEALLRYIGENIRSPRALAAVVSRYYDLLRQAGGPNKGDMFGGGAPVKGDMLEAAMRDARAVTTAADVAEAATPQQRRAALQASVAQAATGRSVEVEPIMTGGSRQDFMDAAERLDSPESVRVADFDAAAEVDQRAGQKSDVETAMDDAMTLAKDAAAGAKFSRGGDGDAAATPRDAVLATARQSFGDATDDLVTAGRIEVVDTVEDLPIPVPADVKGVELGGRVYLVASNLRPDEVRGVVLHEVGVHSGMRGLLGDDVFEQVLADVDARVAAGDKAFVEARERAIAYSNKPEHVREETVAYLVQNAPRLSWVQELLARLKAALYRVTRGKLFDLDEADLQMLAVAALRKAANDERVARMDAAAAFARGEAYHGSPYRFSKFSLEHMGRGEGAQAYGWGLYFAGKREVGEHYRKVLTARNLGDPFMVGGKRYESVKDAKADGVFTDAEIELIDDAELQDAISSLGVRDGLKTFHEAATKYGGDKAVADSIVSKITPDDTATGQLYRVEIPSDDQYLLWDKPLSEQSERVRAAVGALAEKYGYDYGDRTGGEAYRALTSDLNAEGMVGARADAQQAASELLNSLGIAGIKYLDGTSRVAYPFEVQVFGSSGALLKWEKFRTKSEADAFSAEQTAEGKKTNIIERASSDESFNYVIFDDAAIEIVETYYSRGGEQQKPAAPGDLNAELKPFDEAIKRAELYGTAVRAAAERLGDDDAARAAMATATGDRLLAAEVDDLLAMLKKENARVRASLRKARDQFTAEDAADALQDDAMRAAETVANNVKLAAEIEKRNAALNIAAKMRGIQFAQQFADKREGFMALLSGSAVAKNGSRLSAQAEQKAFLGRWTGGMIADLEKAGLWKLFVSDTMSRETMQALSALTSGVEPDAGLPKQAVAMARVVHKYLEDSRLVRNRFGAWIRDLRGYTVRQSHDMFKIRKAGYQAWRDFVLPRLDVERTLREFPDADVERFLQGAYNDFAAGIHMEYLKPEDVAPFKGPGNLAKRQSQSRVIYLKDAAAEHAYLEQFGVGRFSEAILQQLTAAANSAGMLKVLGTNPEANLEAMMDAVESQMVADPVARQKFHEQRKQILSLLGYLDGKANIPGNAMAARISANLRAWQSMAKLGGALLSSITDLAVYASEVKYQGRGGYLSGMSEAIGGLVQGRRGAERRQMLMSMGVFFDSMVGEVNRRFDADDLMGGTSSWLMQKFFKWNGLQWWTESLRMSSALSFSSHLADTAGKSWAKLGPDFQRVLGLYRIDEGKWDVLRMATLREADGRRYLTPDGLDAVPDAALENYLVQAGRTVTPASLTNLRDDLRQALRAMIIDRGEHAIIEPDARTRWWLLRGQPPGTVWGETARFIAQFKGFPVAVLQRTLGREVYGRGSETLSQALRNGNGEMLGLVQLLAWMTLMGYAAMTTKEMLKGKTPRPVDDYRTWMAAMLQGGAAGIYGDFLFGEMRNRFGSGLLSTVAGPVIGTASDVADLWGRVRAGDDAAARAFKLLLQNTPFMNLFYTRIAMDYLFLYNLQEQMNPGYLRRMERRAEQENGQQWLLRPSEAAL